MDDMLKLIECIVPVRGSAITKKIVKAPSLFESARLAFGNRKRFCEGKIPTFKRKDKEDIAAKLIEMADQTMQPAAEDDKQYLGAKGKDQFYVAFDEGEEGDVVGIKVFDAGDDIVLEKSKEDGEDLQDIKAIDDIVSELGLDSVGVQLLHAIGAFDVEEEQPEELAGIDGAAEDMGAEVVDGTEAGAEGEEFSGDVAGDENERPLASDMAASEEDEQAAIDKEEEDKKKPRESVAKRKVNEDASDAQYACIIFDNGGGVTVQAKSIEGDQVKWQQYYEGSKAQVAQAANDSQGIEDGEDAGSWDGNDLERNEDGSIDQSSALDPSSEEIRNGGYRVYNSIDEVMSEEDDPWGVNVQYFIDAIKGSPVFANESTDKKWMQKAFGKNPGKLHKSLGIDPEKEITVAQMKKAKSDPKTAKMAQAAINANPDKYKSLKESRLPFEHNGIVKSSMKIDDDAVTYETEDGGSVYCPSEGGVWLNDKQVSGTADKPFRFIKKAAEEYKSLKESEEDAFDFNEVGMVVTGSDEDGWFVNRVVGGDVGKEVAGPFDTEREADDYRGNIGDKLDDFNDKNPPVIGEGKLPDFAKDDAGEIMRKITEGEFPAHVKDTLMSGISIEDIIDTVVSNEKVRDEKSVLKVFNEIYQANLADAKFELKEKMPMILKAANEPDVNESKKITENESETMDDFVKLISARAAKYVKEGENIDVAIEKAMKEQGTLQDKVRGMLGGDAGGKELKSGLAAGIYKDAQSK